ncbi:MAG TPA: hypothetical protein VFA31_04290 [Candidatus Polarisedimenticolia bacterium]|nr:hypothetical protein [Candidatus Polarisedimenticolia bacterium]
MNGLVAHIGHVAGGNPLYQIGAEHLAGLIALGTLPIVWWLFFRKGVPALAPIEWLLVALLGASAATHAGLAVVNDHGLVLAVLFAIDAVLLLFVARRVLRRSPVGRLGVAVLVGSIVAYWGSALSGEAPEQVGLATKLCEILALAIVLRPAALPSSMWRTARSVAKGLAVVMLVVGTAATSWVGAFRASAANPAALSGHQIHGGTVAPPGMVMPAVPARDATPAERVAADQLILAARTALARYADVRVAAADGYNVAGIAGIDFHAGNPANENDGRILDPAHPETLVYAVAPNGKPVLMGAMFLMPKIGEPGPTVGGPLTVWHAHQHVCISLTPPGLAGLLSPLGSCPIGTIDLALTAEMIHIWIVPGAPEPFGDLDDAWKRAYLAGIASKP